MKTILIALSAVLMMSAAHADPFKRIDGVTEVPFGDADLSGVKNYSRAAPYVAVGGAVDPASVPHLKELGFKTFIDLRLDNEPGVAEVEAAAETAGVSYYRITMPGDPDEIEPVLLKLSERLDDPDHYPILVHCASGNTAGAAWTLYRAGKGVPAEVAIEEGRAAGMTNREDFVRSILKGAE